MGECVRRGGEGPVTGRTSFDDVQGSGPTVAPSETTILPASGLLLAVVMGSG